MNAEDRVTQQNNSGNAVTRRRCVTGIAAGFSSLPFAAAWPANLTGPALTGIDTIDTPAITVRNPAAVLLVALTCAGRRLFACGEHGVIIYSDDAGANWVQASVPVNVTLTCIGFATENLGWAAGHAGVILATSDAGKTWQLQLNGLQANQLTLAAAQAAQSGNNPSPGAPLALARAGRFGEEGADKPFLSLLVFSPQKLIAFGAYRMTMITLDGGKSWADWSLHVYDKYSQNLYATAVIGTDIYLAAEQGLVFKSSDAGNSFLPVASPSATTLFGVLGSLAIGVIVFGVAGAGFRSIDGGASWTPLALTTQENLVAGLLLPGTNWILIASDAGTLFLSKDQGKKFSVVSNTPPMSVFALQQTANGDLLLAGAAGINRLPLQILANA